MFLSLIALEDKGKHIVSNKLSVNKGAMFSESLIAFAILSAGINALLDLASCLEKRSGCCLTQCPAESLKRFNKVK
jgi:hypothetical protein